MAQSTDLWVERKQLRNTRVVSAALPPLGEGEMLVAIDQFGLTSNNVSYAISGDTIGYWGYYPAEMLHNDPKVTQRIIGLTSPSNVAFVDRLGCCDEVVVYGEEANIDATGPAAYVDMSGDARLTAALHNLLGENMVVSAMVGATHWEQRGDTGD